MEDSILEHAINAGFNPEWLTNTKKAKSEDNMIQTKLHALYSKAKRARTEEADAQHPLGGVASASHQPQQQLLPPPPPQQQQAQQGHQHQARQQLQQQQAMVPLPPPAAAVSAAGQQEQGDEEVLLAELAAGPAAAQQQPQGQTEHEQEQEQQDQLAQSPGKLGRWQRTRASRALGFQATAQANGRSRSASAAAAAGSAAVEGFEARALQRRRRQQEQQQPREQQQEGAVQQQQQPQEQQQEGAGQQQQQTPPGQETDALDCRFCLDLLATSEHEALMCGHVFHTQCINRYIEVSGCSRRDSCVYKCHRHIEDVEQRIAELDAAAAAPRQVEAATVQDTAADAEDDIDGGLGRADARLSAASPGRYGFGRPQGYGSGLLYCFARLWLAYSAVARCSMGIRVALTAAARSHLDNSCIAHSLFICLVVWLWPPARFGEYVYMYICMWLEHFCLVVWLWPPEASAAAATATTAQ